MEEYEAQFARRFTAQDEEYQQRVQSGARDPPVLEGWRGARGGGRGGGHIRFHHGGHRGGGDWGGPGWRSGPGGNQHNAPNQRPHYKRY
ncbi:RNMT-activating mini protein [Astyanax mexicanus]|uniref:RNMT-activating mini protein n=1 Tax=Astyanax mexicanus TaxID=7994 RepID=A0A8T2LXG8_ASTMX|nr:RNMT-activating mini protein [Astyanax mexicanus]